MAVRTVTFTLSLLTQIAGRVGHITRIFLPEETNAIDHSIFPRWHRRSTGGNAKLLDKCVSRLAF